jgi:hypothetical protein
MAQVDLGQVRGTDGFSPVIQVVADSLTTYRLSIQDKARTIVTPNLRGITAKSFTVEIDGSRSADISFGEIGLNPDNEYAFYAMPGIDYPRLRQVVAIRVRNSLHIAVYYDTEPYTVPQSGSPFTGGIIRVGAAGLGIGAFKTGEELARDTFPVNILCFEIAEDGRSRVKIGQAGLKISAFQTGQYILPGAI